MSAANKYDYNLEEMCQTLDIQSKETIDIIHKYSHI